MFKVGDILPYKSNKGGTFTVVQEYTPYKYKVTCSVCQLNSELCGDGTYDIGNNVINKRTVPCHCSPSHRLTKDELVIRSKTALDKHPHPYTFLGFEYPSSGKLTAECNIIIHCPICSLDSEMFPYGSIVGNYYNIQKGTKFCGCYPAYKLDKRQTNLKTCRYLKSNHPHYKLDNISWGKNTKYHVANILCTLHGIDFNIKSVNLFAGKIGCYGCCTHIPERLQLAMDNSEGVYKEGTIFTLDKIKTSSEGSYIYLNMYCPVCSNDKYVAVGLCSGVFSISRQHMLEGKKPCRCYERIRLTPEQYLFTAEEILKGHGIIKYKLPSVESTTGNSKLGWICDKAGHLNSNKFNTFIHDGPRCKACSDAENNRNGYYPSRVNETDYLYVIDFGGYIKIGRSFNVNKRKNSFVKHCDPSYGMKILNMYTANHQLIYDTEQRVHGELTYLGMKYNAGWGRRETFNKESYNLAIEFLDRRLEPVIFSTVI